MGFIALMLAYMLFLSVFPLGGILDEYNGYDLRVKTLKGKAEIPFSCISAVEINWIRFVKGPNGNILGNPKTSVP